MVKTKYGTLYSFLYSATSLALMILPSIAGRPGTLFVDRFYDTFLAEHPVRALITFLSLCIGCYVVNILVNSRSSKVNSTVDERRTNILAELKKNYTGLLTEKTEYDANFQINLNLEFSSKGISRKIIESSFIKGYEGTVISDLRIFVDEYLGALRRIAIVGESGCGKSTLLLKVGLNLIDVAIGRPLYPIPVIIDLSRWEVSNSQMIGDFRSFARKNIYRKFEELNLSEADATWAIENYQLLLILDGLDYLKSKYLLNDLNYCIFGVNKYLKNLRLSKQGSFPEIIISSTEEEFYEFTSKSPIIQMPFSAVVRIKPITNLPDELNRLNPQKDPQTTSALIIKILDQFPQLNQILTNPFRLYIALSMAYDFKNYEFITNGQDLLRKYILNALSNLEEASFKSPAKGLIWLAKIDKKKISLGDVVEESLSNKRNEHIQNFIIALTFILCAWCIHPLVYSVIPAIKYRLLVEAAFVIGLWTLLFEKFSFYRRYRDINLLKIFSFIFIQQIMSIVVVISLSRNPSYLVKGILAFLLIFFTIIRSRNYSLTFTIKTFKDGILNLTLSVVDKFLNAILIITVICVVYNNPLIVIYLENNLLTLLIYVFGVSFASSFLLNYFAVIGYLTNSSILPFNIESFLQNATQFGLLARKDGFYSFRDNSIKRWFIELEEQS